MPIKSPTAFAPDNLIGTQDGQSVTSDWDSLQVLIDGVHVKEVKNVVKKNGDVLCEIFRRDWLLDGGTINQVFQSLMNPASISAWHAHQLTTDRLFVSHGLLRIVLYDARAHSSTYERINEFRLGALRPALVVIPPGVWHGVQNISTSAAVVLNLVDHEYQYDDPDHWRLPVDTEKIPYRFER